MLTPPDAGERAASGASGDTVLPPRLRIWPPVAVSGLLATACVAALASITAAAPVGSVCVLGGIVTVVCLAPAIRVDLRRALVDKAREQLAPALGFGQLNRSRVRVHRWSGWLRGRPRTVVVRYARPVRDADPSWKAGIVSTVGHVFGAEYVVAQHRESRCRLVLRQRDTVRARRSGRGGVEVPPRIQELVRQLFGDDATVSDIAFGDDHQLHAIEIHESADPRLVSPEHRQRIERTWSTMLPGRWRSTFDLEAESVRLEVRPTLSTNIWMSVADEPADVRGAYPDVAFDYAVDEGGNRLAWRPAREPNLMLVGAPGSGKTSTNHGILIQAARQGWAVWVVDGSGTKFGGFRDWSNVAIVATTIEEQIATLHRAHELMENRESLLARGRARTEDFEPLLLVLDDWHQFARHSRDRYAGAAGDTSDPPVIQLAHDIAERGRRCRIHLVLGAQYVDPTFLTDELSNRFPTRIGLGRLASDDAEALWHSASAGSSLPRSCPGRAIAASVDGDPVEIQAYRAPDPAHNGEDPDEDHLLERLRPATTRHERLLMSPPDDDATSATYEQVAAAEWVRADDHPQLDPLLVERGTDDLGSPMAVLGIASSRAADPVFDEEAGSDLRSRSWSHVDLFEGYGGSQDVRVTDVRPGDLVCVDEAADSWATAVHAAEPDLIDDDLWCVEWRTDDDVDGTIRIGADEVVAVRRATATTRRWEHHERL